MVGRHPSPEAVTPGPHAEGCQVRLGQVAQPVVHQGVDGSLLGGVIQLDPITDHDVAGLVAPGPAEDEVDSWEHVVAGQLSQDLVPARRGPTSATAPPPMTGPPVHIKPSPVGVGSVTAPDGQPVHTSGAAPFGHQVVGVQADRSTVLAYHRRRPALGGEPVA